MNSVKILEQVDLVKQGLNDMGLGHFPVSVIDSGDRKNSLAMAVTYGAGIFGRHIETLDPQQWEREFLANNVQFIEL